MSTADEIQLLIAFITGIGVMVTIVTPICKAIVQCWRKPKLDIVPSGITNKNSNGDRFLRVSIINKGKIAAHNVQVKVCWGDGMEIPPIPVTWTHTNSRICAYISNKTSEYADIAIDFSNKKDFMISAYLNASDNTNTRAVNDVFVRIIVFADNADLVEKTIRFCRDATGEMHETVVDI